MDALNSLVNWFAGNGRYHNLIHCMGHDTPWIWITILLDVTVASGYGLIAVHWWTNQRLLPDGSPAKRALGNMRNIFLFCGICGYIFIPIKMVWPAWRLYDFFMVVLAYFTWRYAWGAKDLKVVYTELGRSSQLQADLESSRQESRRKSFFLNALSHDLRTPLNGIMLQVNLAEASLEADPAAVRSALTEIKSCTRATAELLDGLLEFAKLDWSDAKNTLTTFPLQQLLSDVCGRARAAAEAKGLSLRLGEIPALNLLTDRVKLERIVTNLLGSAIKFTEKGSVRIEVQSSGDGVEIHVIDTGPGLDPSMHERLFEEFFQAHNHERDPRKGYGLGLAIARRLARQLGGDIQVDGAPGSGSRFTVVLPGVLRQAIRGAGGADDGSGSGHQVIVNAAGTQHDGLVGASR
jgi:signal transduction histidine kinase